MLLLVMAVAEGGGGTSSFGSMIDPAFVTGLEIERGAFSGKGGANSLMGSANLRTINVNDIVKDGENFGFITKNVFGNNAIGPNYMGALAYKQNLGDSAYLGVVYGYSHRKIAQNYSTGGGEDRIDNKALEGYPAKKQSASWDRDIIAFHPHTELTKKLGIAGDPIYNTQEEQRLHGPFGKQYNPGNLIQHPTSHLAKIEYGDDYNKLDLSYRYYKTGLAGRAIHNENYQINYNLKSPDSNNIDLNVLYAYNKGTQNYRKGEAWTGMIVGGELDSKKDDTLILLRGEDKGIETKNDAKTFDISNTFSNSFGEDTNLQTTIGMNILKNKYSKSRHPYELNHVQRWFYSERRGYPMFSANTFFPTGEQKFNTFYIDNTLNTGIFTLGANVNWTRNDFKGEIYDGHTLPIYMEELYQASKGYNPKTRKYGKPDPSAQAKMDSLKEQYGCDYDYDEERYVCNKNGFSYDHFEISKQKEGKHKYVNYAFSISAYLDDLFTPFVNYSKTHRAPNIKEIFFSDVIDYGVNLNLKPESAQTWQVGFNSFKDGLISDDDSFGFKFLVYQSNIKDYIHNTFEWRVDEGHKWYSVRHINSEEKVKIKGLEIELGYDMGWVYTNFSFAKQKTNQPANWTDSSPRVDGDSGFQSDGFEQGYGLTKISMLPKYYGNVDLGFRLFDEKLTIGGIMKFYGASRITSPDIQKIPPNAQCRKLGNADCGKIKVTSTLPKQPNIFDFYVVYQPSENFTIKAEIQNFFDKKYIDPLDANSDSADQFLYSVGVGESYAGNNYARGRTAVLSVSYKY